MKEPTSNNDDASGGSGLEEADGDGDQGGESGDEGVGDNKSGLAVCLCFEGGPGTISTVKVHPALCACSYVFCTRSSFQRAR